MADSDSHTAKNLVDHLFRNESGKMTAILTRIFGLQHSILIEDIIQETFLSALKTWPLKGYPDNPSGWLMQVAKNKALNALKRDRRLTRWDPEMEKEFDEIDRHFLDHEIKDSQLRMLFACCYPELQQKSQIMLILKTLCGFSNTEIAHALLMSSGAVKKAVYRAKNRIQERYDRISFRSAGPVNERLNTVYMVIYLMFTEGHKRSCEDNPISDDLCYEAVRLAKLLLHLPGVNHGETHALLSLMYFSIARFPARLGEEGEMVDLKHQDRSLWDKKSIDLGFRHLKLSRKSKSMSRFHLESSIASIHCLAPSFEETDWEAILTIYRKLLDMEDSAVIRLNYAIALSHVEGPEAGLKALKNLSLESPEGKEFMLYAAKAEMNAKLEKFETAVSYYRVAYDMAATKADKKFLQSKIEECDRKNLSHN